MLSRPDTNPNPLNAIRLIERSFDASRINEIINHGEVHPWVTLPRQGPVDLSALVADPNNILLMTEGGGFFFHQLEPCIYEVHTNFLPSARGHVPLLAAIEAAHWMFTRTDCMEILTKVPVHNLAADLLTRSMGFTLEFERSAAWPIQDGAVDVKYYALRYAKWVAHSPNLSRRGHWFHDRLEAEKADHGATSDNHPEDDIHDRNVGAALEMAFAGNVGKALTLYNRWARFAGYAEIGLISLNPLIVDIRDAWMLIHNGDIEVLKCP